ncbi:MAG: hypothetical protein GY797_16490 [Deltaproteobacteria bacterium]|nr:hypothetical protein [Deltaproteobacteria bacterium]
MAPISPAWLEGTEEYQLPEWFDKHRGQLHTRLAKYTYFKRTNPTLFYHAAEEFKKVGATVFTRHIRPDIFGAWWPSKIGKVMEDAKERNIAREIIEDAHKHGMKFIVYTRHNADVDMAEKHPDWIARDPNGKIYWDTNKPMMCFNSPYADFYLTRALELIELGADGFYFDWIHMPKQGCWCAYCQQKFTAETGLEPPQKYDPKDPLWWKYKEFTNITIERMFLRYRKAFHNLNPNIVMVISSHIWSALNESHTTHRLYRIVDSPKTEFRTGLKHHVGLIKVPQDGAPFAKDIKQTMGFVLLRDAAGGRPPHVWVPFLVNGSSALYATAGLIAHGCIANLDMQEETIPNMDFVRAFELGEKVSEYFSGTKPLHWIALHFSEYARDSYKFDHKRAWQNVLYPLYGAYHTLVRARLPVNFITDSQLDDGLLQGYQILFISDKDRLTEPMKQTITSFQASGGKVFYNSSKWQWHTPEGQKTAMEGFLQLLKADILSAPVQVIGGSGKMHVDSFYHQDKQRLTVACVNDFSWVSTKRLERMKKNNPKAAEKIINRKPPPPCTGVTVILRNEFGRPPIKLIEAVSGKALGYTYITSENEIHISLPTFEYLAVVVAEY